eukprot:476936-Prorocentrum_minimum.AAC.1
MTGPDFVCAISTFVDRPGGTGGDNDSSYFGAGTPPGSDPEADRKAERSTPEPPAASYVAKVGVLSASLPLLAKEDP